MEGRTGPAAQRGQGEKIFCTRCIYNEDTPGIHFDEEGMCNYCKLYDEMNRQYPIGEEGDKVLRELAAKIRRGGKRKPFDVVIGVSGGCDSSFLLYKAKELGLRPLAVHYDNTWNSNIATENIRNVLKHLDVELYTHVVDNEVANDIYRAFLQAGILEIDIPTDIALATTIYMAAARYGIKYSFEGHSFRTEGVSPLGWAYMDAKYIQDVVRRYGHYKEHKLKTFPNLWLTTFLRYMLVNRIKRIRPLYWMDYDKDEAKKMLAEKFDWQWYGGHHLENRITAFMHSYLLPTRGRIDQRSNGFSALIRSGQISREEGMRCMAEPPHLEADILDVVKKRLSFSDEEFEQVMTQPIKTFREFKTYKSTFERMRPFFWLMYKMDLVPRSFYVKFACKVDPTRK
ncbi:MAG: N-acetyl sugar amidotransferase [Kiritimatiellae bacterium]|nr:N-acetyl sugar amidotransferase [Kiritimatiellia bacterium]